MIGTTRSDQAALSSVAQPPESTSACSKTVCVAFSWRSGGYPCLSQDALHQDAELGADVFTNRPIDCDVGSHRDDELPCDRAQRIIAEHLHCTVVRFERVVEGNFIGAAFTAVSLARAYVLR